MPSKNRSGEKSFLSKIKEDRKERNALLSSSSSQNESENTFNYVNFPLPTSSSATSSTNNNGTYNSTAKTSSNPSYKNDDFIQSYYNMDQRSLIDKNGGGFHNDNDQKSIGSSISIATRYRRGQKLMSSTSELVFRTTTSTKMAMKELAQRRYEAKQRKKAISLFIFLVLIACSIFYTSKSEYILGTNLPNGAMLSMVDSETSETMEIGTMLTNSTSNEGLNQTSSSSTESSQNDKEQSDSAKKTQDENEPPPEEEEIEEGNEFLQPLKYFADLTTQSRTSDSNFFFHIPRSGGQTVKDIVGKCLRMTLASEVGVRDGHAQDTTLQVIDQNGAKYVNVDTTSIEGLHRAASMNLASSGLSDMITSSYFGEVGMLFDLHHKGRAFVLLRDPMVRAVSMYHYKTQGDTPMIDPSVSLEDYAQGNGIENNWVTRFLTGRMEGELTKEDLEHAKVIIEKKFLIGFLDDGEETVYRLMKYFGFSFAEDETVKMEQEDCIKDLLKEGTNHNTVTYEMPKRGSQAAALIKWQTQFDIKLFDFAKELFDAQTKLYGSKERKKALRKKKKEGH